MSCPGKRPAPSQGLSARAGTASQDLPVQERKGEELHTSCFLLAKGPPRRVLTDPHFWVARKPDAEWYLLVQWKAHGG